VASLAPKSSIATISGTFLAPGASLNGRLYTVDNIRDAVTRMQAQIADGNAPVVSQYDSHYEDSVLHTVGKITDAQQMPDGSARFTASVPDTQAGRDLATLTSTDYLRNVSIAAYWVGDMEEKEVDGEWITTAPGLDVRRIDYVADPGVPAAKIDSVVLSESAPGTWREMFTTEAAEVQPSKPKREGFRPAYADPGFREDGRPDCLWQRRSRSRMRGGRSARVPVMRRRIWRARGPVSAPPRPSRASSSGSTGATEPAWR